MKYGVWLEYLSIDALSNTTKTVWDSLYAPYLDNRRYPAYRSASECNSDNPVTSY
jgi:hypothetical protein